MKERVFSAQFRKDIDKYKQWNNLYIHNRLIPDTYRGGKRPYDSYIHYEGIFAAIEFKIVNGASIAKEILKPHQESALKEVYKTKGIGLVIVLVSRLKKVFVFELYEWNAMFYEHGRLIKVEELQDKMDDQDNKRILQRMRTTNGTIWDIKKFLKVVEDYHNILQGV